MNNTYIESRTKEIVLHLTKYKDVSEEQIRKSRDRNKANRYYRNLKKYGLLIDSTVDGFQKWIDEHLAVIDPNLITNHIIDELGFGAIRKKASTRKETEEIRNFCAEALSADTEICRFFSDALNARMDAMYSTLLDVTLSKQQKIKRIEPEWFIYDVLRNEALSFYDNVAVRNLGLIKFGDIAYTDLKGETHSVVAETDRLLGIAFPYDLRAARLLFDMYRLCGHSDQLEWAFTFTYNYIYRLFVLGMIRSVMDLFKEPTIDGNTGRPVSETLGDTVRGLSGMITEFETNTDGIPSEKFDSYIITEYPELDDLWERGIGTFESTQSEEGMLRNYTFALVNSLPAVYFLKDMIAWLVHHDPSNPESDVREIESYYTQLNVIEQKLVMMFYKSVLTYDSASRETDLERISHYEDSIARQISICNGLSEIAQLVSLGNLDLLFSKKHDVVESLQLEGVNIPEIEKRLSEIVESAADNISRQIADASYDTKYINEIHRILNREHIDRSKYDLSVFCNMLGSAEYLYDRYIRDMDEVESFDYSFVAILYYKALESLLNTCFYVPYINESKIGSTKLKDFRPLQQDDFGDFFPSASYSKLVSRSRKIQRTCELGKLGNIIKSDICPENLKEYFSSIFSISEAERIDFGARVLEASGERNNAAHGSRIMTYQDAQRAREDTYDISAEILEYKGLILEFLTFFNGGC